MKKAVWSGVMAAVGLVLFAGAASAQQTDTKSINVQVNVNARAKLTLGTLGKMREPVRTRLQIPRAQNDGSSTLQTLGATAEIARRPDDLCSPPCRRGGTSQAPAHAH